MNHLKPAQIVDAAEGSPAPSVREHLIQCDRCRDEVARAAATIGVVRTADVPEPSPMFWEHFSRRVREQIDATAIADVGRSGGRSFWVPAAAALAATVAIVGLISFTRPHSPRPTPASSGVTATATRAGDTLLPSSGDDENWTLVAESAEGFEWEESAAVGLTVRPGAAERAAMELSDDQRQELARLLREEIGSL